MNIEYIKKEIEKHPLSNFITELNKKPGFGHEYIHVYSNLNIDVSLGSESIYPIKDSNIEGLMDLICEDIYNNYINEIPESRRFRRNRVMFYEFYKGFKRDKKLRDILK